MQGFSHTGTTWLGYRRSTSQYRRMLAVMFFAGIAAFAQLYAPQTILVPLSEYFDVSISSAALSVSMATFGLAAAVLPWSIVADRIGRRKTIAIAVSAATLCALALALTSSFELMLALRTLEGIALAGVPAAGIAYINEEIHPSDAAVASAIFVTGNSLGGISGRLITGPVTELSGSWQFGLFIVAIVSIICAVLFIVFAPRAHGYVPDRKHKLPLVKQIGTTSRIVLSHLKNPLMQVLYVQSFVVMGGFVAIYNYLGVHLSQEPFSLPVWLTSLAFLAYLGGSIVSPLAAKVSGRFGRKRVMLFLHGVTLSTLLLMGFESLWLVILGLLLFTAAFFGAHAVAIGWVGAAAATGRAQATSVCNLLYYLGSSCLGWVGGLFFEQFGWTTLLLVLFVLYTTNLAIATVLLPDDRANGRGETARPRR